MAYSKYPPVKDDVKKLREKLEFEFTGGYLFWGEEEYLKNHYRRVLKDKIRDEGMSDFNLVSVNFERDGRFEDIKEALDTPPVFAPHKLIEVTGLNLLELKKDEEKLLCELAEDRAEDTVLLFTFYHDELDLSSKKIRERKLIKDLSACLTVVEFPRQPREKLLSWTDKIFTSESLHINDADIVKMIELCDYSMTRLKNESDKLICRAKFEKITSIPSVWVVDTVKPTAENELYELSEAVIAMDRSKATRIYENLDAQNFDPVIIFSTVSRAVVSLCALWSARESNVRPEDAAGIAGLFDWQAKKYSNFLSSRTADGIKKSLDECYRCDTLLKWDTADKRLLLNKLIVTLCSESCK